MRVLVGCEESGILTHALRRAWIAARRADPAWGWAKEIL
jgi:hypothetical protein